MKPIDWEVVPNDGTTVILTMNNITAHGDLFMADFRDTHVLMFSPTKNYIGLTKTRGIRLSKGPLQMTNGIWFGFEDLEVQGKYKNVELTPELVSLAILP